MHYLEPVIRERYAMIEKYGENWQDKPVRLLLLYVFNHSGRDV